MALNSFGTAVYIVGSLSLAGAAHVLWLRSAPARAWLTSVDFGLCFRQKRLFGENKKLRGFVVMPPASAATFAAVDAMRHRLPEWLAAGIWPVPAVTLAGVGFLAGFGFLLAELPNSFVKRQLEVAPGSPAHPGPTRVAFLLVDRLDSGLGALLAITIWAPLSAMTWFWALLMGTTAHAAFSVGLYLLRAKSRPF